MKKIFLLLVLFVSFAFSAIDEYKIDVYFGNGILTTKKGAKFNAEVVLKPEIISLYPTLEDFKNEIGEVGYSYNQTAGDWDKLEAAFQKFDWDGLLDYFFEDHFTDVQGHVEKYKNRILAGHKVLVVAHSQGNLFALDAYEKLGEESKDGWKRGKNIS